MYHLLDSFDEVAKEHFAAGTQRGSGEYLNYRLGRREGNFYIDVE